jgi:hypothetical protein
MSLKASVSGRPRPNQWRREATQAANRSANQDSSIGRCWRSKTRNWKRLWELYVPRAELAVLVDQVGDRAVLDAVRAALSALDPGIEVADLPLLSGLEPHDAGLDHARHVTRRPWPSPELARDAERTAPAGRNPTQEPPE